MRLLSAGLASTAAAFGLLKPGKTCVTIDLKSDPGIGAASCHCLRMPTFWSSSSGPGVMDKLGLGYEALRSAQSAAIYCSITGYGQSGRARSKAGHDLNYSAIPACCWHRRRDLSTGPTLPPALVADIGGGAFPAVINILLALRQRDRSGQGCHLDIAMADAMFTFAWHALACLWATGTEPRPGEGELAGGLPRYRLYPSKDGVPIACAPLEDHFWQRFTSAIGVDVTASADAVATAIAARTAAEWEPVFAKADCCVSVMRSLDDALRDPHFIGRGLFGRSVRGVNGGSMPALPLPIAPQFRDSRSRKKRCRRWLR